MLTSELKSALRSLRRRPGFTLVAVLSLGLGIGASTTLFSFVNALLLAPLPFPEPSRLVRLEDLEKGKPMNGSPARFLDLIAGSSALSAGAGFYGEDMTVSLGSVPERVGGLRTFGSLLGTLGISPVLGRGFTAEEEKGRGRVVVVTDRFFTTRLGGKRDVLGTKLLLSGVPHEIAGVLAPGVRFGDAELFTPDPQQTFPRSARFLTQIARLAPGATIESAAADLARVSQALAATYPDTDRDLAVNVGTYRESRVTETRLPLLVLFGAVTAVLLIACLNVASLSLDSSLGRSRELAIRQVLGAGQAGLVRLILLESALLAAAGCVLGLLLASAGVAASKGLLPADLPRLETVRVDWAVAGFAVLLAAVSALVSGLLPALHAGRTSVNATVRSGDRGSTRRHGSRSVFVVLEVGLSLTLLVGAVLMLRTFANLEARPLGFSPTRLLTFRLSLPWQTPDAEVHGLYSRVLHDLETLPGVTGVALTDRLPFDGGSMDGDVAIPDTPGATGRIQWRTVSTGYHGVVGVPLLAGRHLSPADEGKPVAVINASAARTYFASADPVGQRVGLRWKGTAPGKEPLFEIVGVVGDVPGSMRERTAEPAFSTPFDQTLWPLARFVLRTEGDPAALAQTVRKRVAALAPEQPVEDVMTMDRHLASVKLASRSQTGLLTGFALTALGLAALGLYGLLSNLVGERHRELSVRMALGASPRDVLALVLRQGLVLVAVGSALGLFAGSALAGALKGLLFGVEGFDVPTFLAATLAMLVVAILAAGRPALRASRIDPVLGLRQE